MRPTEESDRGAGAGAGAFEVAATTGTTRRDRYGRRFRTFVVAPLRIVWNDWRGRIGLLTVLAYLFVGTVGVLTVPKPTMDYTAKYVPPFQSLAHPLGTNAVGQDLLQLMVHGTPPMLLMIAGGAVFTTVVATVVGVVSGYKGGYVDRALMTVTDIAMTIPGLPLIIVLSVIIEPENPLVVGVIIAINSWAGLARALRSQVLTLRNESYVEASRVMNLPTFDVLSRDVLPNLLSYVMIRFVEAARNIIFGSVALYFLGILPFTGTNWGVVLNEAYNRGAIFTAAQVHAILVPMFVIVLLAYALLLLAQATDRIFNPRIRAKHEG